MPGRNCQRSRGMAYRNGTILHDGHANWLETGPAARKPPSLVLPATAQYLVCLEDAPSATREAETFASPPACSGDDAFCRPARIALHATCRSFGIECWPCNGSRNTGASGSPPYTLDRRREGARKQLLRRLQLQWITNKTMNINISLSNALNLWRIKNQKPSVK